MKPLNPSALSLIHHQFGAFCSVLLCQVDLRPCSHVTNVGYNSLNNGQSLDDGIIRREWATARIVGLWIWALVYPSAGFAAIRVLGSNGVDMVRDIRRRLGESSQIQTRDSESRIRAFAGSSAR